MIGFCVLTYKRGGAVKTGPTIFFKKYQKSGYGQLFRKALEEKLIRENIRKIYCTSSVNNGPVIRYLLASGYKIEVQLSKQYGTYDELVFGKFISNEQGRGRDLYFPLAKKIRSSLLSNSDSKNMLLSLTDFIKINFTKDIIDINKKISRNFLKDSIRLRDLTYEDKPKTIITRVHRNKIIMSALLLPKRGGAIKCVLLSSVRNTCSLREIIKDVEKFSIDNKRHRLYFTVPEYREDIIHALKEEKYLIEGMLHSPYRSGVNFLIIAKIH